MTQPSTVAVQNGSSVGMCTRRVHVFARLAPDLHAQSVISNKISASELRRNFIKSALLVGNLFLTAVVHVHVNFVAFYFQVKVCESVKLLY